LKTDKRQAALLCDSLGPEDGIDPRHFFQTRSKTSFDRKTHQLCKQVRQALDLALAETTEPALCGLGVARVSPAPDAGRLLTILTPYPDRAPPSEAAVTAALARARGRLRTEVAAAINRKKVPALDFRYLPTEEVVP
jgi:ribosome-binding factor A